LERCVQGRNWMGAVEGALRGLILWCDNCVGFGGTRDVVLVNGSARARLRLGEMRRCISVDECVKRQFDPLEL